MKRKVITAALVFSGFLIIGIFWQFYGGDVVVPHTGPVAVPGNAVATQVMPGQQRQSLGVNTRSPILTAATDSESDPDALNEMIEREVENIPDANVRPVLEHLVGKETAATSLLRQLLVRRWAEKDPNSAARWVLQGVDSATYKEAIPQVAIAWAGVDPQAATAWTISLPENPEKAQALLNIGYELASTQPSITLGIASTLTPGVDRDNLLVHGISQWASTDIQTASTWVDQVQDNSLRERLQAAIAVSLADKNGEHAGALVATLAPGQAQDRAVIETVQRWGQTAPSNAGAWIATFPNTALRQTALKALVGVWSVQDDISAANWVHHLPSGALRDAGFAALAE